MRNGHGGAHRATRRTGRLRRPFAGIAVVGLIVGTLVASGNGLANAAQATGDDAAAWQTGWSWTYATTFNYDDGNGTNANIQETVTYSNAGPTTYNGQSAYKVNLSGTITGGSGHTSAAGGVSLDSFSGSVTGYEYIRRADLALLQEYQHQDLKATAHKVVGIGVTASIDLTLTPSPGWRTEDFPLNSGDHWTENEAIAYTGGFSYNSSLASGSSPFNGTMNVDGPANVSKQTINPGIGSISTDYVAAASSDGSTVDNQWWSPQYANVAQEHMVAPLDGSSLVIDRYLTGANIPAPNTSLTETITPSLSCAGGPVTVSGRLSSGASGQNLTVSLAQQAVPAAQQQTVTATTGANGAYSATITSPWASDGLNKNGSRGNWGVLVDGGGASQVATLVVTAQDCTTLAYTGDTSAPIGGTATVSAKLGDVGNSGAVNGRTITFSLSGGGSVNATTNSSGVATATLNVPGPARAATISASFAGSSTMTAASTSSGFTVTTDPTSTAVIATPPSVTIGDPVTFTASVTPTLGSNPTGTVQFVVDGANFGAPVAVSNGTASSAPLSTLGLGTHTVVANYSGDATFAPSTSPSTTFKVHNPLLPSTTGLTLSTDTAVYGQPVTATATATVAPTSGTGAPTGTVSFTEGAVPLGTAQVVSGQAQLTLPALPVGGHTIRASYSGDDTYDASTASASLVVSPAATQVSVSSSASDAVTGQSVSYTATVQANSPGSGTPTGTAVLKVDGNQVGDPVQLVNGVAVFPAITNLTAGSHTIAATYSGDANFSGSTGTTSQTVAQAATSTTVTTSPSPSLEDQTVTITATVTAQAPGSGSPTGTVTFTSDGNSIGAATVDSSSGTAQAVLQTGDLPDGTHSIVATYGGDPNYASSTSPAVTQKVISAAAQEPTTTTLTSSTNPSTYGQLISFTATVTSNDASAGTPQGSVQFSVDGTNIGDPVALDDTGSATSVSLASPEPGDHTVIAAFLPAAGFDASGATLTQTVSDATVTNALSSSDASSDYGQAVTFTATVTSDVLGTQAPTGVVQFSVDGKALGAAVTLTDGSATSATISSLTPGTHTVTALYSGDDHFLPKATSITQTVAKVATSTTLAVSTTTPTYGDPVTLTATVTPATGSLGAPTGTVTFSDGSTQLGTVPVAAAGNNGTASLTTDTLHGGSHSITATYSGDPTYLGSTSAATTVVVARQATSLYARPALVRLLPLGLPLGMLRGELSDASGAPLGGMPLTFSIAGKTVCSTYTDPDGHADCNARPELIQLTLALGYDVTFPGDTDYLPSTAHGTIIK